MNTYEVFYEKTITYTIEVEADSAKEAESQARDKIENDEYYFMLESTELKHLDTELIYEET